jgi:hypothetical protein
VQTNVREHVPVVNWRNRHIVVSIVGCGGTGSQIATGLPYLHQALLAAGHPYGLRVFLIDGDRISETNCVRQPFSRSEVGLYKVVVLINRLNLFWGLGSGAPLRSLRTGCSGFRFCGVMCGHARGASRNRPGSEPQITTLPLLAGHWQLGGSRPICTRSAFAQGSQGSHEAPALRARTFPIDHPSASGRTGSPAGMQRCRGARSAGAIRQRLDCHL